MNKIIILSLASLLASCANPAQTRNEFVVKAPKTENHVINRSYQAVMTSLRKKSDDCLNGSIRGEMHGSQGYAGGKTTRRYRSKIRQINSGKSEITVQLIQGGQRMPPGGYYFLAINIAKITSKKTKLTIHGPSMAFEHRGAFAAIKKWSEGKNVTCPQFI